MWWDVSPRDVVDGFSCEASPVYARFAEWGITSSAGGSTVNVRATIRKDLADEPLAVLSWQIDGEGTITAVPAGFHVAGMSGRGVPAPGNRWQAEVLVTVHDENHNRVVNAAVSGAWTESGISPEISCITDGNGTCQVTSDDLKFVITETTFLVEQEPPPPFLVEYNHYNNFKVNQV